MSGAKGLATIAVAALWISAYGPSALSATTTSGSAPSHAVTSPESPESLETQLRRVNEFFEAEEYTAADGVMRALLADPAFAALREDQKAALYALAGLLAAAVGDSERAWTMFDRTLAAPDVDPSLVLPILQFAIEADQPLKAVAPMRVLAARSPESIRELDSRVVYRLDRDLNRQGAAAADRIEFLQALYDSGYLIEDGRQPSALWLELTRLRLEQGNLPAAIEVARRISSASELMVMQVDARFAPVVAALDPAQLVLEVALSRELDQLAEAIQREPRVLLNFIDRTYVLMSAGRYRDTLEECDAVLARAAIAKGEPAFDDEAEEMVWVHDSRARALLGLGRADEAIAVWETARLVPEYGGDNVSQAINLGQVYSALARRDDALNAIAGVRDASPYGWMQYHAVRLSALVDTPDDPRAKESLAFLREHRTDSQGTYVDALLRLGDMDEASRAYREWLADPALRADALDYVQGYIRAPISPRALVWDARRVELTRRPEVAEAIAAVGTIKQVPLHLLMP